MKTEEKNEKILAFLKHLEECERISVKDELPEESAKYWVVNDEGEIFPHYFAAGRKIFLAKDNITHWIRPEDAKKFKFDNLLVK